MNDQTIKSLLGFLIEKKESLSQYLDYFEPADLRNGILSIPEELINNPCKKPILAKLAPNVHDYKVTFSGDYIFLDLNLNIKQLGPIKAMYLLSVEKCVFEPQMHRLSFTYREDIRPQGGPMQSMMLKTFLLNQGSLLQKAVSLSKLKAIQVNRTHIFVDLDRVPLFTSAFFEKLSIQYVQSQDGKLTCRFTFLE
ncbi:hypothetical protein [Sinanaerobacter sp. ZZT-01]|uniref:hypothetical protein n=1 Tax=Sinanaerobacter sp. ZZT-01 TaxID=3111540 RepID=UPI002D781A67|nr:hypothetical protein [Sinanaerobacter sp. ZZT-01]WRR94295.1 hypothetical protein U5921_04005 [Sinanaerobacter sp. ZZT-01]